ncbi:hypothetical protein AVEN_124321-1 [Araneus ventricosus]|uniref:Uncharacterized protein n=1 Tax=Araneus ventricosus TaxID=182803 RepID=A0A4Y2MU24_ARAVE|nr:hypothetical protein AVEN_124321-1 [Araneus ventricosus]
MLILKEECRWVNESSSLLCSVFRLDGLSIMKPLWDHFFSQNRKGNKPTVKWLAFLGSRSSADYLSLALMVLLKRHLTSSNAVSTAEICGEVAAKISYIFGG